MKKIITLIMALMVFAIGWSKDYKLITSLNELESGKEYIIASTVKNSSYAMGAQKTAKSSSYRESVGADIKNDVISTSTNQSICSVKIEGNSTDGYTLCCDGTKYLNTTASGKLNNDGTSSSKWNIDVTNNVAKISFKSINTLYIQYNSNSPRFSCYSNSLTNVSLYKEVEASTTPTITVDQSALSFGCAANGSDTKTIKVSGEKLTGDVTLAISGDNASLFTVTPASLSVTDGTLASTEVTVTYSPTSTGIHTAILTISSDGATSKIVTLTGTVTAPQLPQIQKPTVTDATNVTSTGFTVNWNAVANATGYNVKVSNFKEFFNKDLYNLNPTGLKKLGWTLNDQVYADNSYIKLGSSNGGGEITLPIIEGLSGDATLVFNASQYKTDSGVILNVSISSGKGSITNGNITLEATKKEYKVNITGADNTSRIKLFTSVKNKRAYIYDIKVIAKNETVKEAESGATSLEFTGLTEDTEYSCSVQAKGDGTSYSDSEWSDAKAAKTAKGVVAPTLSVDPESLQLSCVAGSATTGTLTIMGENLTSDITLSGLEETMFSVDKTTISRDENNEAIEEVTVTYSPTSAGTHTATLTISSDGATSKSVTLNGTATAPSTQLAIPTVTDVTDVTTTSFTVNWDAVDNATSYNVEAYKSIDKFKGDLSSIQSIGDVKNKGWAYDNGYYEADKDPKYSNNVVKIGSGKNKGYIELPKADGIYAEAYLNLVLKSYGSDNTIVNLSVENGGTLSQESIELSSDKKTYKVLVQGVKKDTKIKLYNEGGNQRFYVYDAFLTVAGTDEVTEDMVDATNYTFSELSPNTAYAYRVQSANDDDEESDWSDFYMATTLDDHTSVTENLNKSLGYGAKVIADMNLTGVYADDRYLYAVTDAGNCSNVQTSPAVGDANYSYYQDNSANFKQRDCVKIFIDNQNDYVGKTIKGLRLDVEEGENMVYEAPENVTDGAVISYNTYSARNFNGVTQDKSIFVMTPQENEVAKVVGFIKGGEGMYTISSKEAGEVPLYDYNEKVITSDLLYDEKDPNRYVCVTVLITKDNDGAYELTAISASPEDTPTGAETVIANTDTTITVANGEIEVKATNGTEITVYDLAGRKISDTTTREDEARISLNAGAYIVKAGNAVSKVIVK